MRRRVAVVVAALLVVTGLAALAVWRLAPTRCLDQVVEADELAAPLPAPAADSRPDPRLGRLIAAAESWGQGRVVASLGYDYDRHVEIAGLAGGYAVWLKGTDQMTFIDPGGEARWGIRQARARHTWDASAERFVLLAAPAKEAVQVSAHAMKNGSRRWCVELAQEPLGRLDPISTNVDKAGNVVVLAGPADDLRLTSLAAEDGTARWTTALTGVDRGDYVSSAHDGVIVVGGRPAHELAEPATETSVLAGIDEATGKVRWRHEVGTGATASVVGDSDGQVVVREASPRGHRLLMLDQRSGAERWTSEPIDPAADVTVRGGVVLIRTATALSALDLGTGRQRWDSPVRQRPQQFPYGFRLAEQPMLDEDHLLLGTTDALVRLRLSDGRRTRWELPVDGISTTYWPYRVTLSEDSMAVATNIGAVVVGGD